MITPETLDKLVTAFSMGSRISVETPPEDFLQINGTHVASRFGPIEQQALFSIWQAGGRGIVTDQRVILQNSKSTSNTLVAGQGHSSLTQEASLVAEAILYSQYAYFCYRQGRNRVAVELLRRAFCKDLKLERHGYDVLHMHRIQILTNLMRETGTDKRWINALTLGARLLSYLETGNAASLSSLEMPWRLCWLGLPPCVPVELLCLLHDQIARQTIHSFQSAASDCATPPELCAVLEELLSEGNPQGQVKLWIEFSPIPSSIDEPSRGGGRHAGARYAAERLRFSVALEVRELFYTATDARSSSAERSW